MARAAAKATKASLQFHVASLTASELALQSAVAQLTRRVGYYGHEVARMRQECDCKWEDVLFKLDDLQIYLDSTSSQFLGFLPY